MGGLKIRGVSVRDCPGRWLDFDNDHYEVSRAVKGTSQSAIGSTRDLFLEATLHAVPYGRMWRWLRRCINAGFWDRAMHRKNIIHGGSETVWGDL